MKTYEPYLLDEDENIINDCHKELAIDGVYKPLISDEDINKNGTQCEVVSAIFHTVCFLIQKEDIEMSTAYFFSFSIIKSVIDNKQTLIESPRLSREKLLPLSTFVLTKVITELILDYPNWDQTLKYSTILSDGNGNWLL